MICGSSFRPTGWSVINETSQPNETNSTPCIATSPAILLLSAALCRQVFHMAYFHVSVTFFKCFINKMMRYFVEIVENSPYYMDFAIFTSNIYFDASLLNRDKKANSVMS